MDILILILIITIAATAIVALIAAEMLRRRIEAVENELFTYIFMKGHHLNGPHNRQ